MKMITERCSWGGLPLSIMLGVFLALAPHAQADYSVELDGSYAQGDDPFGDIDDLNLSVEAFLRPVDDLSLIHI